MIRKSAGNVNVSCRCFTRRCVLVCQSLVLLCLHALACGFMRADETGGHLGRRDLLLMLPSGPLHVRLRITDGDHSLEQLRAEYLDRLIVRLDTNKDGQLSSDETRNHALFMTGKRFGDTALVKSLAPARGMNRNAIEQSIERAIGKSMVFRQIASVADQDLQVFKILDEDQSGLIERNEMRTAAARLAARDLDHDYCIVFDEFVATNNNSMLPEVASPMVTQDAPPPVHSELLRDAREPVMASRLIRTYDVDKDAKLSIDELHWEESRVALLDENHDGVLAVAELSKIADSEPDVHVEIELSVPTEATPKGDFAQPSGSKAISTGANTASKKDRVQLISARRSASAQVLEGGMIEIKQPSTTITLTYRPRDPVEESLRNAREAFNAIDLDGNGYIDRNEILTHPRFQRYLFDAMDADHDDRVFVKEMDEYVKGIAEPSATICQVTLFDSGNGYFQMLDRNGDGRISIRELRTAEEHLLSNAVGDSTELNPSQLPRYFRIEMQRGGPTLFGPGNRPRAEVPLPVMRTSSGPIWFQRADRNGDGDLVWDEFIGPREVFDRLDQDKDGLIDPAEANAAG